MSVVQHAGFYEAAGVSQTDSNKHNFRRYSQVRLINNLSQTDVCLGGLTRTHTPCSALCFQTSAGAEQASGCKQAQPDTHSVIIDWET